MDRADPGADVEDRHSVSPARGQALDQPRGGAIRPALPIQLEIAFRPSGSELVADRAGATGTAAAVQARTSWRMKRT